MKRTVLFTKYLPFSITGVSRHGGRDGGGKVIAFGSGVVVGGEEAVDI